MEKSKKVIIKTHGTIAVLRNINGPILTPFDLDLPSISHLVVTGYAVYEVGPDGSEVKLTKENYNKNNFRKPKNTVVPPVKPPVAPPAQTGTTEPEKKDGTGSEDDAEQSDKGDSVPESGEQKIADKDQQSGQNQGNRNNNQHQNRNGGNKNQNQNYNKAGNGQTK